MNYGISPGGGFGVSIPFSGYGSTQGYTPYQGQSWGNTTTYTQPSMGYSYTTTNRGSPYQQQYPSYSQPQTQGWTTMQPQGYNQAYSTPQQVYYQPPPPQQSFGYGYPSFMPGCGNCGHTKPMVRRDW